MINYIWCCKRGNVTKHETIDFNSKINMSGKHPKENLSLLDACIWNGGKPQSFEIILQHCCCVDWKDKELNKYRLYPSVEFQYFFAYFLFWNLLC